MLTLIAVLLVGLAAAFFANQNSITTTVSFLTYSFTAVPLYVVVLVSMLIGVFLSAIISLINGIYSGLALHGKDVELSKSQKKIDSLRERNQTLEIENARLKRGGIIEPVRQEHETVEERSVERPRVSIGNRLRQTFNPRYR